MYFKQISTVLPDTRLNIMDEYKSLGLEKYEAQVHTVIYGIKEIRVLPDTEDFIDFIARPLRNLIRNGVESSSIKFVIYCHTAPWVMPPWQQTGLLSEVSKYFPQARFFGTNANKCVSVISALELASVILKNLPRPSSGIILAGERALSLGLRVVKNLTIIGDGAGAMVVSNEPDNDYSEKLLSVSVKTEGQYAKGYWLEGEPARRYEHGYNDAMKNTIQKAAMAAQVDIADINWIVPHNVNRRAWQNLVELIGLDKSCLILYNLKFMGHCFGLDMLLNLEMLRERHPSEGHDTCMMACAGLGGIYGAAIFNRSSDMGNASLHVDGRTP